MIDTRTEGFTVTISGFEYEPDSSPLGMSHENVILNLTIEVSGTIYSDYEGGFVSDRYAYIVEIDFLCVDYIEDGSDAMSTDAQEVWSDFILMNKATRDAFIAELEHDENVQCLILNGD
tara:strand:- start:963 stop:1319 length:357 start_codon:yes stop_codon:yes gene_type:complete